jgi:aminopeptidase-like protein
MDKRGLYSYLSFTEKKFNYQRKYIDFMIYSDGKNNIDQIAKKIKLNYKISFKIFKLLLNKKLIRV